MTEIFIYACEALLAIATSVLSFKDINAAIINKQWLSFWLLVCIPLFSFLLIYLTYLSNSAQANTIGDLHGRLDTANKHLDNMRQYNFVATLDYDGSQITGNLISPLKITSYLKPLLKINDRRRELLQIICSDTRQFDQVINLETTFPFAYYYKAVCMQRQGDDSWKDVARKAKDILDITTSITGHVQFHDTALKYINGALIDNSPLFPQN